MLPDGTNLRDVGGSDVGGSFTERFILGVVLIRAVAGGWPLLPVLALIRPVGGGALLLPAHRRQNSIVGGGEENSG